MTKKVAKHPEIREGEMVLHACYGLSASFTQLGNTAASGLSAAAKNQPSLGGNKTDLWDADFDGTDGMASPINQTGVMALTDQRLIYFKKLFAIGSPKEILATWPVDQLVGVTYEGNVLRLTFFDGSMGGLHVPAAQKPKRFLEAFEEVSRNRN